MSNTNKDQNSFINGLQTYFKGVRAEWGKITWPPKQQVIGETIYVLFIVFIFTLFVLLLDNGFSWIFSLLSKSPIK